MTSDSDSDNDAYNDELRVDETQSSSDSDHEAHRKKLRGKAVNYGLASNRHVFDDNAQLDAWMVTHGKDWRSYRARTTKKCDIQDYRCCYGAWQKTGYSCEAAMRVRRPHDSSVSIVEVGDRAHNHQLTNPAKASSLSDEVKKFVRDRMKDGLTPARIQDKLIDQGNTGVKLKVIQNFYSRERKHEGLTGPISNDEFEQYVAEHSVPPESPDAGFVAGSRFVPSENGKQFIVIWTTQKLIGLQSSQNSVQVDGTYKLNWHGFPVLLAGFSDANHRFFPTFIGIVSDETHETYGTFFKFISAACDEWSPKYFMADGDRAIRKAARTVWPCAQRGMCYYHAIKNLKDKLRTLKNDEISKQIQVYVCTCSTGAKKYPCKHSIYVMLHFKKTIVNPYANTVERKRKSGRPRLAKNALQVDD